MYLVFTGFKNKKFVQIWDKTINVAFSALFVSQLYYSSYYFIY